MSSAAVVTGALRINRFCAQDEITTFPYRTDRKLFHSCRIFTF